MPRRVPLVTVIIGPPGLEEGLSLPAAVRQLLREWEEESR